MISSDTIRQVKHYLCSLASQITMLLQTKTTIIFLRRKARLVKIENQFNIGKRWCSMVTKSINCNGIYTWSAALRLHCKICRYLDCFTAIYNSFHYVESSYLQRTLLKELQINVGIWGSNQQNMTQRDPQEDKHWTGPIHFMHPENCNEHVERDIAKLVWTRVRRMTVERYPHTWCLFRTSSKKISMVTLSENMQDGHLGLINSVHRRVKLGKRDRRLIDTAIQIIDTGERIRQERDFLTIFMDFIKPPDRIGPFDCVPFEEQKHISLQHRGLKFERSDDPGTVCNESTWTYVSTLLALKRYFKCRFDAPSR